MPVHFLNKSQVGIQAMAKWLEVQLFQNSSYFILFHLSTSCTSFHIFIFLCSIQQSTEFLQVKKFSMIFHKTPMYDFWYLYETKFHTAHSFVSHMDFAWTSMRSEFRHFWFKLFEDVLPPVFSQSSLTMADHIPALYTHTNRSIPNHWYPFPIKELRQNPSKLSSKFRWNLG